MRLGVLYHMPCWQAADGSLWEAEGAFARYVDALAAHADEVLLAVPVFDRPPAAGTRIAAPNVRLAPLPYFPGPRQFYPRLPAIRRRLRAWVAQCDLVHLRVPTPAGLVAFRLARAQGVPVFLLVVGDYAALRPHLPYRGAKRALFAAYVACEEAALRYMTRRALTFANGPALVAKHARAGARVHQTITTTLRAADVAPRADACAAAPVRLLAVSRIDPRKNLRVLPGVVAALAAEGIDATLDVIGPTIGRVGEAERAAILAEAGRLGVADRVALGGPVPLDDLPAVYRRHDVFVLPTGPGEGIPRVLLEAMAAGLPVVTTNVAGIGGLVAHGENGLLVDAPSPGALAAAVASIVRSPELRRRLVRGGEATARAHTVERQVEAMLAVVRASMRPTVCFVLPSLAGGGAERAAVQVLNGVDGGAWRRVLYLFAREGPYLEGLAPDVELAAGRARTRLGRWLELRRFVRRARPAVVVAFLSYFTILTAVRAARTGARVVFSQQTPVSAFLDDAGYAWSRPWRRRLFEAVGRIGYAAADLVIASSPGVADDLVARFGARAGRTRVVPNPVDLPAVAAAAAAPIEPAHAARWRRPVIVAAGRLAEAKNYPLLIEALALVRRRVPATLFILGEGGEEAALRALVARLGLDEAVVFAGFQANPWRYIARADLFALTSRYEGFGNVLVEAMACGVPVVATASPGTRAIVRDGVDGVLVAEHTPEAVAAALLRLIDSEGERRGLGEAARASAARFAAPEVARAFSAALQEAVA